MRLPHRTHLAVVGGLALGLALLGCGGASNDPEPGDPPKAAAPVMPRGYEVLASWRCKDLHGGNANLDVSACGKFVAWGNANSGIEVVAVTSGKRVFSLPSGNQLRPYAFRFSHDGTALLHVRDTHVTAYHVPSWRQLASAKVKKSASWTFCALPVPPSRSFLLSCDAREWLWSPDRPKAFVELDKWYFMPIEVFPDGRRLLGSEVHMPGHDGTPSHSNKAWVRTILGPDAPPVELKVTWGFQCPRVSPKGNLIAGTSQRHKVILFSEKGGNDYEEVSVTVPVESTAFLSGGDHVLAWVGSGRELAVVDVAAQRQVGTIKLPWDIHEIVPFRKLPRLAVFTDTPDYTVHLIDLDLNALAPRSP